MRNPYNMPPFAKLRGRMCEAGETSEMLGQAVGRSRKQIDIRLNLHVPFELDLIHDIMDHYAIPESMMYEFFPRNGGVKPGRRAA